LDRSLTVLLPVRDAQASLAAAVQELLDILPELTDRFELMVIDDGSQDATIEVAQELATRYPQVRVVRHGQPKGRAAAVQTGLQHTSGEVVFLRDEGCRLAIDQLKRLWQAMEKHDLVLGRPQSLSGPVLNRWRNPAPSATSGCQMAHRRIIESIRDVLADQESLRESLRRLGRSWHEIELPQKNVKKGRQACLAASSRPAE